MRYRAAALTAVAILVAAQFERFPQTNPPAHGPLEAPAVVGAILRRACYDCHSNQTSWPWYSGVAPISWWIYHHVSEGRRRLNFSQWSDYASDPGTKAQKLDEIAKLVRNRTMPPWYYRLVHPRARLSSEEREIIVRWVADENSTEPAIP